MKKNSKIWYEAQSMNLTLLTCLSYQFKMYSGKQAFRQLRLSRLSRKAFSAFLEVDLACRGVRDLWWRSHEVSSQLTKLGVRIGRSKLSACVAQLSLVRRMGPSLTQTLALGVKLIE